MMIEPDFMYYRSPWGLFPAGAFVFFSLVLLSTLLMRRKLLANLGAARYYSMLAFEAFTVGIMAWMIASNFQRDVNRPHLVIHREYFSCASWRDDGVMLRVPWHYFDSVSVLRTGKLDLDVVIHFALAPENINRVPWTDWVRSNRQVNCQIRDLTDDPKRFDFPTGTDAIYGQVRRAWLSRLNNPWGRPTYKDLMDARRSGRPQ